MLCKPTVFKRPVSLTNHQKNIRFGEASFEMLSDFLTSLNDQNKSHLQKVSSGCGNFKAGKVVEHAILICESLGLDTFVAYHGTEILERFMVKHIENLFSLKKSDICDDASCGKNETYEELVFQNLKEKFYLYIVSSLQIASKLTFNSSVIDNSSASRYLQSVDRSCPKHKLLESELLILKTLDFKVNLLSPLSYVETLLEVLGHNDPTIPITHLHHLCRYVLQFICLRRETIYHSLLASVTLSFSPSSDQRAKFQSVTQDYMLLGAGVIIVAAFIYQISWEKVMEALTLITGISSKSMIDFAYVTLWNITKNNMMDNLKKLSLASF